MIESAKAESNLPVSQSCMSYSLNEDELTTSSVYYSVAQVPVEFEDVTISNSSYLLALQAVNVEGSKVSSVAPKCPANKSLLSYTVYRLTDERRSGNKLDKICRKYY